MTDVATLLGEFVDDLNAGRGPEAAAFIEKAESEADRKELAQGIEAVLAFAPDGARQAAAATSPIDASQLAAAIENALESTSELAEAVPGWRETFGASVADFARRVLTAGGLSTTDENVAVATQWVTGMESGAVIAESLSDRAMRAVSTVLGSGGEELDFAFRAENDVADDEVAAKLGGIAEALSDALVDASAADEDVEAWFATDAPA